MIGNTSRQEKQKHVGNLSGQVAVVTGASRGIGRGIALALAEEGATVYVTGRTVEPGSSRLPGTVGDTAAEATRRGGKGIAVAVDHGNDAQVAALFAQVSDEQGRLDILVNNAIHLPEDINEPGGFWQKPISHWKMIDIGLRSVGIQSSEVSHGDTAGVELGNELLAARKAQAAALTAEGVTGAKARRILLPLDETIARHRVVPVMVLMPDKEFSDTLEFDAAKIEEAILAGRKLVADEWPKLKAFLGV